MEIPAAPAVTSVATIVGDSAESPQPAETQSPAAKKTPGRPSKAAEHKRAAERQAWMDQRHPGWSCLEWSQRTGNAYETIKKYRDGVTTNRTSSIRADIARAEKVEFSAVPE
jgi:hypothetical protein